MIQVGLVGDEICRGAVLQLADFAQRPHRILEALAIGDAVDYEHCIGPLDLVDWKAIIVVNRDVDDFNIEQAALQRDGLFIQQVGV